MNQLGTDEIKRLWNLVFNLALNFLHDPTAAEDATQEIFGKAAAAAGSFRGESQVGTWLYRIAYNHLVDQKRSTFREPISFELFEHDVNNFTDFQNELGLSESEMAVYTEQIKAGCTKAMLQCLDPDDRFVYIVGKLFGLGSQEGATCCGLSETAYRQRLSRATRKIANFMNRNCGLVSPDARCTCRKRIGVALERGRINPDRLLHHIDSPTIGDCLGRMNDLDSIAEAYRDNPFVDASELMSGPVRQAVMEVTALINP